MTENSDETAMGEPVHTTAVRLQEIKSRLDAATPGPWRTVRGHDELRGRYQVEGRIIVAGKNLMKAEDAELIAHAPEDLRFLLAEVERYRETLEGVLNGEWDPDYDAPAYEDPFVNGIRNYVRKALGHAKGGEK